MRPTGDAPGSVRRRAADGARGGFTLIELLVAIGILGLLAAIATVAVNGARRRSIDTKCMNNLRNIGNAVQAYQMAKGSYPMGGLDFRTFKNRNGRQLSWCVFLLPYLEHSDVYRRIDQKKAFDSKENAEAARAVLPVFLCPTSERPSLLVSGRGACDYGGIFGERITSPNNPPKGVMLYDQKVAPRDVKDGLQHTLMISEDTRWGDGQWINAANVFDQAFRINQAPPIENDIRSNHLGGAFGLFCDGRVALLAEEMDRDVLAAICTRARQERIEPLRIESFLQ